MYDVEKPQFCGVKAAAANIGQGASAYTEEMFRADFPQFYTAEGVSLVPEAVLAEFIAQANASIQPDKWLNGWRYACGLYVAHYATLYLRTYAESSAPRHRRRPPGRPSAWWNLPHWGTPVSATTPPP